EAFSAEGLVASAPGLHPALFADHGTIHARDVAAGVVDLAGTAGGLLLPARPADRWEFVVSLAVLLAYLHHVGMKDPTPKAAEFTLCVSRTRSSRGRWTTSSPGSGTAAARSCGGSSRSPPWRRSASARTSSFASSPHSRSSTASRPYPSRSMPTS